MQIHNAMREPASLVSITSSLAFVIPEIILVSSVCINLLLGLFLKKNKAIVLTLVTSSAFILAISFILIHWQYKPESIFASSLRVDDFSSFFRLLFLTGGLLTLLFLYKGKCNRVCNPDSGYCVRCMSASHEYALCHRTRFPRIGFAQWICSGQFCV